MSAPDVICEALGFALRLGGRDDRPKVASRILDALAAAGYAIVKLPEPDDPSVYDFGEYCKAAWLIAENDDGDTLNVAVYGQHVEVDIPMDENRFDPECARELAAALLAAADTAEAQA